MLHPPTYPPSFSFSFSYIPTQLLSIFLSQPSPSSLWNSASFSILPSLELFFRVTFSIFIFSNIHIQFLPSFHFLRERVLGPHSEREGLISSPADPVTFSGNPAPQSKRGTLGQEPEKELGQAGKEGLGHGPLDDFRTPQAHSSATRL